MGVAKTGVTNDKILQNYWVALLEFITQILLWNINEHAAVKKKLPIYCEWEIFSYFWRGGCIQYIILKIESQQLCLTVERTHDHACLEIASNRKAVPLEPEIIYPYISSFIKIRKYRNVYASSPF